MTAGAAGPLLAAALLALPGCSPPEPETVVLASGRAVGDGRIEYRVPDGQPVSIEVRCDLGHQDHAVLFGGGVRMDEVHFELGRNPWARRGLDVELVDEGVTEQPHELADLRPPGSMHAVRYRVSLTLEIRPERGFSPRNRILELGIAGVPPIRERFGIRILSEPDGGFRVTAPFGIECDDW